VNPIDIINEYGTDALRYFVCKELSTFEDSPFTAAGFKEAYNAGLANGLGNLVSRVMKMAQDNLDEPIMVNERDVDAEYADALNGFNIQAASNMIWQQIAEVDRTIQETQPFKLVKTSKADGQGIIRDLVAKIYHIGHLLAPFMPETSKTIKDLVKANKMPEKPLFMRK
jgi:methionyl-tRNA synthetase